jgi:hypothetical protein
MNSWKTTDSCSASMAIMCGSLDAKELVEAHRKGMYLTLMIIKVKYVIEIERDKLRIL